MQQQQQQESRRSGKGRCIALSRKTYRIVKSDVYYVESETSDNIYYFVKYNPDVFEICSCPDSWTRHVTCKHLHAVTFAIRMGTLKDIDKLPKEAKRYTSSTVVQQSKSSYKEDQYDF